ncbi:MAG: 2,3,4,5-tetrahydropyridine-2,6-dicarboxylate N-succinyltransferase [Bdellovibrionaceae bacterium]|nr:2,3,4,5-tetrahydropyridine-2,6-dicarboxylate N-succinyltransferase [Pseudobdellovibrionaceae bacterium]
MTIDFSTLQKTIEAAFQESTQQTARQSTGTIASETVHAVETTIAALDRGELRVVARQGSEWIVNEWVKKAILLYFRQRKMEPIESGEFRYVDKIPVKKWNGTEGVRVVPQAIARYGSYIASGAILMPSYVNIGASVGSGTMVDTWATVGSCAYIGANVHLSGGVGIGGVLEPVQARPVIVEDNAFIGSRCIVVEGVHIEEGAVLGAGVTLTGSTKIIDVTGSSPKIYQGRVPKNAVVIPGSQPKTFASGTYHVPCALIIGSRKESTNQKTSLTDALREYDVPA